MTTKKLVAWEIPPSLRCKDGVLPKLLDDVRLIYNESLTTLATKPLTALSKKQQYDWWNNLDHSKERLWVYTLAEGSPVVAFMKLTDRGSHFTPIMAIGEKYRKLNVVHEIVAHYLAVTTPKPVIAQVLRTNLAMQFVMNWAGFEFSGTPEQDVYEFVYHHPEAS